jgi:hypothetical protein
MARLRPLMHPMLPVAKGLHHTSMVGPLAALEPVPQRFVSGNELYRGRLIRPSPSKKTDILAMRASYHAGADVSFTLFAVGKTKARTSASGPARPPTYDRNVVLCGSHLTSFALSEPLVLDAVISLRTRLEDDLCTAQFEAARGFTHFCSR